jgi:hypothetical protein
MKFHYSEERPVALNTREIRPTRANIRKKGAQTWTPQKENNAKQRENFVHKQKYFSMNNNNNAVEWKYIDLRSSVVRRLSKVNNCLKIAK